eukprot:GHVN01095760.1.p1 GENE.GHVN01095760.1~~GHVN01095760.1.p1  ORF type:complete len:623 (-),score=47.33 GHVN01095760.1:13-1881(-)
MFVINHQMAVFGKYTAIAVFCMLSFFGFMRLCRAHAVRAASSAEVHADEKALASAKDTPSSFYFCIGNTPQDKICRFKDLFYDPERNEYFIVAGDGAVIDKARDAKGFLDLSSLDGHTSFSFSLTTLPPDIFHDKYKDTPINEIDGTTYIFSRFHTGNIMHSLHDDIVPQYMARLLFQPNTSLKNNRIFFGDESGKSSYHELYTAISNEVWHKSDWAKPKKTLVRFRDAVVGQPKISTWYQYGFRAPQGPIADKKVDGKLLRMAARHIMAEYDLKSLPSAEQVRAVLKSIGPAKAKNTRSKDDFVISIFSRKKDRLILNENDLKQRLEEIYGLRAVFVRLEEMPLKKVIATMNKTALAVGVHGSLLIAGMFMPQGSIMVELYPFAVPADNYTPYREMCSLPGMDIAYRAWENKHRENNVLPPNRTRLKGGLYHLPAEEQKKIRETETVPLHKCCSNPYWLYRIYQNTIVDIDEMSALIDGAIAESLGRTLDTGITPGRAESVVCEALDGNKLRVSWTRPWNTAHCTYEVWSHQFYKTYHVDGTSIVFDMLEKDKWYDFWIKAIDGKRAGEYCEKVSCINFEKEPLLVSLGEKTRNEYIALKSSAPRTKAKNNRIASLNEKLK